MMTRLRGRIIRVNLQWLFETDSNTYALSANGNRTEALTMFELLRNSSIEVSGEIKDNLFTIDLDTLTEEFL
jgi:hypothetical protein